MHSEAYDRSRFREARLLAKRPRGYRDSVTRVYAGRIVASGVLIAATTLIIALLEPVAPVISLGALYIVAVLAAAVLWGLLFAVGVSTVSLLVFNWVFLPPVHTFALEDRPTGRRCSSI